MSAGTKFLNELDLANACSGFGRGVSDATTAAESDDEDSDCAVPRKAEDDCFLEHSLFTQEVEKSVQHAETGETHEVPSDAESEEMDPSRTWPLLPTMRDASDPPRPKGHRGRVVDFNPRVMMAVYRVR
ncbi:unnamed protein product [Effrenium voratum]|nr:unnamed protein product [Effrenium voratum]